MEEQKKKIEEQISEMKDISTGLVELLDGIPLSKEIDVNQSIAEYYSNKHDMVQLE